MQTATETIRRWLQSLGTLCATNLSVQDVQDKLRAYVPILEREFDARYFTADSLTFVATKAKWFPSYGEVVGWLREWRSEANFGMPSAPLSSAPQIEGPTRSGRARPCVTITELVEHEMGYRALRWTDYGVYPYTAAEREAAEADVRRRLEYRRTAPPPAETIRRPAALRDVTLKGPMLAAMRRAAGIPTAEPPDPLAHPHATAALAVAPAMRASAARERERV